MTDWENIKITVSKAKEKKTNPFEWKEPSIPSTKEITIIVEDNRFDLALSDLLERMFLSVDAELSEKELTNIKRFENPSFPDQFILSYRNVKLGLVFVTKDMFSTKINFRSELKNFIKQIP